MMKKYKLEVSIFLNTLGLDNEQLKELSGKMDIEIKRTVAEMYKEQKYVHPKWEIQNVKTYFYKYFGKVKFHFQWLKWKVKRN